MKNKNTFLGLIILTILVLGTVYTLFIRPSYYRFNGGEATLRPSSHKEVISDEFVSMTTSGGYIYECNKNGLIKKEADGTVVWSKSYYMEFPLLVNRGDYFAVGEITGKKVMVFNEGGFLHEVDVSYPILDVYVNEGGFLSVIEEDAEQNYIHYYNNKGEGVVDKATVFIQNGYPIDHVTSPDVKGLVTGYLNVGDNKLDTILSFFRFDDKYEDSEFLIGGLTYENSLLSDLYWLPENRVLAVMDNQIAVIKFEDTVKELTVLNLDAVVKEVVVLDDGFVLWYGDAFRQTEDTIANAVVLYDFEGNVIKPHTYNERILGVHGGGEGFFVATTSQIINYKDKNAEWFASTYLTIEDFYYISEDQFIAVTSTGYELLQMQNR